MAIYKVQYESNGKHWDFNMTSNTPLTEHDGSVVSAAVRDSVRSYEGGRGTLLTSVRIIMVTEVK